MTLVFYLHQTSGYSGHPGISAPGGHLHQMDGCSKAHLPVFCQGVSQESFPHRRHDTSYQI